MTNEVRQYSRLIVTMAFLSLAAPLAAEAQTKPPIPVNGHKSGGLPRVSVIHRADSFEPSAPSPAPPSDVPDVRRTAPQYVPRPAAPALPLNEDPDVNALLQQQQKMGQQMGALNQLNPMAAPAPTHGSGEVQLQGDAQLQGDGQSPPSASQLFSSLPETSVPEAYRGILRFLKQPAVLLRIERMQNALVDPKFQKDAQAIANNQNLKWLYFGMALVFIFYILVKKRALAATDNLWLRIVVRLSLIPLFMISLLVVDYLVLGRPFVDMLWAFRKILF